MADILIDKSEFTLSEVIDEFEMDDNTIELIGYVDKITVPEQAKNGAQVMKFIIDNAMGRKIQIQVWEKQIPIFQEYIAINNVLHLQGMLSKASTRSSAYNDGNVNFTLTMKTHSSINKLGIFKSANSKKISLETKCDMKDVCKFNGEIITTGYVKINFNKLTTKFSEKYIGCLADGQFKLEVHILNKNEFLNIEEIKKGNKVEVKGTINIIKDHNVAILIVKNFTDIKILPVDKLPMWNLLNSIKYVPTV